MADTRFEDEAGEQRCDRLGLGDDHNNVIELHCYLHLLLHHGAVPFANVGLMAPACPRTAGA